MYLSRALGLFIAGLISVAPLAAENSEIAKLPLLNKASYAKDLTSKGEELFEQGKYSEALERFKSALSEDPENFELHFLMGQALFEMGDFTAATQSFQKSLRINPGFSRARLELARSYYASGRLDDAREALERSQSDPRVPRDVREQAERILAELGKKPAMTLSGALIINQAFATNPARGPGSIPLVASGQEVLSEGNPILSESNRTSDEYQTIVLSVNHSYPLSMKGLLWKNAMNVSGQFYHRVSANTNHSGYIGTGLDWSKGPYLFSGMFSGTILYIAKDISRNGVSGSFNFSHQYSSKFSYRAGITYGKRHHFAPEGQFYDATSGWSQYYSLGASYLFSPLDTFRADVNYLYDNAPTSFTTGSTIAEATKYGRYQASLGYTHLFAPQWSASGKITYYHAEYKNVNLQYLRKRSDNSWAGRLSGNYRINTNYSLDLAGSYNRTRSNLPTFDFHNAAIELALTTLF